MPHIKQERRSYYGKILDQLPEILNKGELEYCIYCVIRRYMQNRDRKYHELHEAVYGTIHAAEEYKRLHLDKGEDKAIIVNGEAGV